MIELPKDLARVKEPQDMPMAYFLHPVKSKVYEARLVAVAAPGNLVVILYDTGFNWEAAIVTDEQLFHTEEDAMYSNLALLQEAANNAQNKLIAAFKRQQQHQRDLQTGAAAGRKAAKARRPTRLKPTLSDDEEYDEEEDDDL